MPIPHEVLMTLWYRALEAEIGIAIPSSDRRMMANEMYVARGKMGDPQLMELTIQQPAKSDQLWVCHKSVEIPEE